ncbi:LppM family (lipo)protein [Sanguibacter antarcticus]|uniref:LppM domain-containing protein n=1 Tax=Sanguibacter antarcticus TaxID=372484 RepID=A0A2A9E7U7_9MICO|nr:hypothetical protein [Sanguibacter antarcticus]PFG35028.1 hypothetical protein ATL42_2961 [Sanguibacter antarcticus]
MSRRRLALAAGAALVVAAITGCGKVTAEVVVQDDASYDITFYMLGDDAEIATTGATPDQMAETLVSTLESTPGTDDWTFTTYSADGFSGVEAVGTGIAGDEATMFGTGLFESDDETVTFDFQYPMTLVVEGSGLTEEQGAAVTINMVVDFPGTVLEHNGALIDDHTIEWTATGDDDLDFTATSATSTADPSTTTEPAEEEITEPADDASDEVAAADEDSSDSDADEDGVNWLLWISATVAVLAIGALVAWFVVRGRGPRDPSGPGAPGHPGAQQPWGPYQPPA